MSRSPSEPVEILLKKGVQILQPETTYISPEVDLELISSKDVIIYPGCRIYGEKTLIMDGCRLGQQGPVTIDNCQLGQEVQLKGGTFQDSTFLSRVSIGPGAEVRGGCLLEEAARAAHTVGLKQTILLPFVTLGSLINFCDCLMAGGTDEKNHSEVGSSYIHFNYTPNQDKATASLIGDVPRGVMINQRPIFLGGQGGIVGPVRINYGVVVAAGTIIRKDILKENSITLGSPAISKSMPFHPGLYSNIKRIIQLNSIYIANLIALKQWYLNVRSQFMGSNHLEKKLFISAVEKIQGAISERISRLGQVAFRMPESIKIYERISGGKVSEKVIKRKREFLEKWPEIEQVFAASLKMQEKPPVVHRFLEFLEDKRHEYGHDYLACIKGLNKTEATIGTSWLQETVDHIVSSVWKCIPSFIE